MSEIDWSRLKASEIRALAARNAIVIVPIGATEQHGPHLPSMVDWRCVHEVSIAPPGSWRRRRRLW